MLPGKEKKKKKEGRKPRKHHVIMNALPLPNPSALPIDRGWGRKSTVLFCLSISKPSLQVLDWALLPQMAITGPTRRCLHHSSAALLVHACLLSLRGAWTALGAAGVRADAGPAQNVRFHGQLIRCSGPSRAVSQQTRPPNP